MTDGIYIVEKGEYSDYRVIAAFSTEEKADEAVETWNRRYGDRWDKEPYRSGILPLDCDPKTHSPKSYLSFLDDEEQEEGYEVRVSGDEVDVEPESWDVGGDDKFVFDLSHAQNHNMIPEEFVVQVSFVECRDDREVAKRIAFDRIAMWKAAYHGLC